MPYINLETQEKLKEFDEVVKNLRTNNSNVLAYMLSQLLVMYLSENGITEKSMGEIRSALSLTREEFARRVSGPFYKQQAFEASMHGRDLYGIHG